MSKEYDTTDHITVLSELNVLYQIASETNAKIDAKNKELKKIKELQKKKEDVIRRSSRATGRSSISVPRT